MTDTALHNLCSVKSSRAAELLLTPPRAMHVCHASVAACVAGVPTSPSPQYRSLSTLLGVHSQDRSALEHGISCLRFSWHNQLFIGMPINQWKTLLVLALQPLLAHTLWQWSFPASQNRGRRLWAGVQATCCACPAGSSGKRVKMVKHEAKRA